MFCLYFLLGIVACFIVYTLILFFIKKITISKVKNLLESLRDWFTEKNHNLEDKFDYLIEKHPIFVKPWLWLLIGLILGFTLVYIVTFIKNQEIVISFLSAFGTIAAVWASITFHIQDNRKKIIVETTVNYIGGNVGMENEISVESYVINTSKFDLRVRFIGLSVFNKHCGQIDIDSEKEGTSILIKHGQVSEKFIAKKQDIILSLEEIQRIKVTYGYSRKPILNPDEFIFQALFEVDNNQYYGSDKADLADAPFWKEIKDTIKKDKV